MCTTYDARNEIRQVHSQSRTLLLLIVLMLVLFVLRIMFMGRGRADISDLQTRSFLVHKHFSKSDLTQPEVRGCLKNRLLARGNRERTVEGIVATLGPRAERTEYRLESDSTCCSGSRKTCSCWKLNLSVFRRSREVFARARRPKKGKALLGSARKAPERGHQHSK